MQNPCVGRFNLHFCVVCSCSRESHVISASRDSKSWKSWRLDFHESRVVTTSREVIKTPSQVVPTISTTWKKKRTIRVGHNKIWKKKGGGGGGAQSIFCLTIFQLCDLHKILYSIIVNTFHHSFVIKFSGKWCKSVFPNNIFMPANNIFWHIFHARHFYTVKLVKIIYTNLLKASLDKPSSLCQGCTVKLEVLRECRPPWPRPIIAPILPTVKMLSLGGERLPPPKKKSFGSLPAPRSGYATTIMVFFLLIYSS